MFFNEKSLITYHGSVSEESASYDHHPYSDHSGSVPPKLGRPDLSGVPEPPSKI